MDDLNITAPTVHVRMHNIEPLTGKTSGMYCKQQYPHPAGQTLTRLDGHERQVKITTGIVLTRKDGHVMLTRQFAHEFDTIRFGASKTTTETVNDKRNFQGTISHGDVCLQDGSGIFAGTAQYWWNARP